MVWEDQNQNSDQVPKDLFERIITNPRIFIAVFFAGILIWFLSGVYFVQEGEVGIIRRFGKEVGQATPGINYHLPWPIEQRNIVNITNIRRAEIGFRSEATMGKLQRVISESLMLTGDENIVDAQMIIQYKIQDPSKFLFRLRSPEETLYAASEVALRSVVGKTTIDEVLTTGRGQIQAGAREFLQTLMDNYQSGIQVTEVKLQVVDPPDQVKDAFHEVVRAREDRERLINQAKGYKEDLIPRARGQAEKTIRESEAYKSERVLKAQGDAARFLALYEEYQKAKQVTRDRLYLETMERILRKAPKFVVDPNVPTNIVPVMNPSAAYLGLLEAQSKPVSNEAGSSKLSYPEFSVRGGSR